MKTESLDDPRLFPKVIEIAIRMGLIILLVVWCFAIIRPFIIPILWGLIIAVASNPAYQWLKYKLGERSGFTATLFVLLALLLLIVPIVMLSTTAVNSIHLFSQDLADGAITIPPPSKNVASWPLIGEQLHQFWSTASTNLAAALETIKPHLKDLGSWLLSTVAGIGVGILQFIIAIIIAGILLAHAKGAHQAAQRIAEQLADERGLQFIKLAGATVRSVAQGILGVALIQSLLAGMGFLVVGIPGAGIWALICLLLSVIQIGVFPVIIPIVIYVFSTANTLTAFIFLIWCIFVGIIDNILKPILLGRGVDVPMTVIFIGVIGGFITSGIVGLFVGSVVLVLGYTLLITWISQSKISPNMTRSDSSGESIATSNH